MSIVVTELTQTCPACPSQWEGKTADGRVIYIRYRWGVLEVGLGMDINAAVDDSDNWFRELNDKYHGILTADQLVEATRGHFDLPISLVT